ncbi:ribosomal protein S12 [Histoplasma capsulatum G186AR]|uniref:Ribosomal protein S12 n=1 Tax=Ajellomyces capsulatus (strain G186AR / H82 / ATCC MYA-2454 / RMSCC 2432) TaxID=447093 RepID=C0NP64_AJECG|nr:ribosomal protein S12 [Histoplasma capsulatum G186AR]EEH06724.1 ribosomal protein S12 [Histoplasma capsulatum G186AR]
MSPPTPSAGVIRSLRHFISRPYCLSSPLSTSSKRTFSLLHRPPHTTPPLRRKLTSVQYICTPSSLSSPSRKFSSTLYHNATLNQVRRGCRKGKRARKTTSPALVGRPQMKGVCLKTGITKPKKPNSGERKTARIRLTNGAVVTGYIPGEGLSWCAVPSCPWSVGFVWRWQPYHQPLEVRDEEAEECLMQFG